MKLINTLPFPVALFKAGRRSPYVALPAARAAAVARVESEIVDRQQVCATARGKGETGFRVTVGSVRWGQIVNLPAPRPDVALVVSVYVAAAACCNGRGASDLLVPQDLVRDDDGQIVGCRGLARAATSLPGLHDDQPSPTFVDAPAGEAPAARTAAPRRDGPIYGAATSVAVQASRGSPRIIPARFRLVSAAELVPSHDAMSFAERPDYPRGVQERRYDADRGEQAKVIDIAQSMAPGLLQNTSVGAVDGTPVVAAGDALIVLGGNGRSMGSQRHYELGRSDLRDFLRANARQFGFTAAQVRRVADPIIVREIEAPRKEWPRLVRDLNVALTQTMDATTEAAAQARQLPPDVLTTLAEGLRGGVEIGDLLRSTGSRPLVGALERSGFIARGNRGRMIGETGLLTREAAGQFERQLLAHLVPDPGLLDRLGAEVRNSLSRSAPLWLAAAAAGPEWDVRESLLVALAELQALRGSGQCLAQWLQQGSLLREVSGAATAEGSGGRLLLEIFDLAADKPAVMHRIARGFFESSQAGGGLFGGVDPLQALRSAAAAQKVVPETATSRRRCKK